MQGGRVAIGVDMQCVNLTYLSKEEVVHLRKKFIG